MGSQLFARKSIKQLLEEAQGDNRLRRILGPVQLTSLGVGCVIGAGIFVITGRAAHDTTGPALMLSFVVAGFACIFAALCYAEFASMAPVAGSAYTYAYATMGELFAWIIGWDLVLEYSVAAATVAHGWSAHFQEFLRTLHITIPSALAAAPFDEFGKLKPSHPILDLPAILISVIVTMVLVKGIRESATFNTAMVIIKVATVFFVIAVGAFYVNPNNWHPFAPYGYTGISFFGHTIAGQTKGGLPGGIPLGMLSGAAIIFFAYIGFDSVSTHAEEAKNPQRDVPIGIIVSLVLCTLLYIAVSAVLTGMVPYDKISIGAPVADAFRQVGLPWAEFLISLGALTGITSVLLVLMLSQPRVMLAMARDGLVPIGFFGAVHPKFRTPWKSTILTGVFVAVLSGLLPLQILSDLVNIGTLLAFVMVCAAVLIMRKTDPHAVRPFRCPWSPMVPILGMGICLLLMFSLPTINWWRLFIWLAIGMVIYIGYGRRHSIMARPKSATPKGFPVVADEPVPAPEVA
ncbi:MAG TPA: amino acid permease [Phycisphaerae bacterium]|nr:amino acid permease [Phycisphaerae bacterium]